MPTQSTTPPAKSSATQAKRRALYGLNVLIAAVAAIGIVVLINWIIAWRYDALPPTVKQYVRYDLTSTRAYSLSPQTLKVLGNLDGEREIVTLFRGGSAALDRIRELIDEYARYGSKITVRHINPSFDVIGRDAFFNDVKSRYDSQLQPAEDAIRSALTALTQLRGTFTQTETEMTELLRDESLKEPNTLAFIRSLATNSQETATGLETLERGFNDKLDHPLPSYRELVHDVQSTIDQTAQWLDNAAARMNNTVSNGRDSSKVKEAFLTTIERFKLASREASKVVEKLDEIESVEPYEQARAIFASNESVTVMSTEKAQVLPVSDLFREIDAEAATAEGLTEPPFIGEERITGALVSLDQKTKPLVVFMLATPRRPTWPNETYEYVAQRLRAANMDVQQWNAAGTPTQFNQMIPPGPLPTPEQGQTATYVVLPMMETDDPSMMMMTSSAKDQIAEKLRQRLEAGNSAMVLLAQDFAAKYGASNPIMDVLLEWGITPQLDRIVLHEMQTDERRRVAMPQSEVTQWPIDTPIGAGMRGQRVTFVLSSPISLDNEATGKAGVTHHKLVELREQRMWAQVGLNSAEDMLNAKFNADESADAFVVATASERENARLITFATQRWATDRITTYGVSLRGTGPGAALDPGGFASMPGNTELFINSVYWLAHMDHLIAASARTQDIRRIEPMSDQQRTTYWIALLAGMPVATLFAGIAVYFVRRRA